LNRSPNRRSGSSTAQRCNLSCILRTVAHAESESGQTTAPVFTGASSTIAAFSLTDTLPPFPMCRAFPGSEYYDGSAPSAPFGRRRAYPLSPSWLNGSAWNEPRTVPTFTVVRSTGEAPGFTPAASPRLRRRPSPRPPDPGLCYPAESSPSSTTDDRCAPPPSPYPPDLSWSRLQEVSTPVPRVCLPVSLTGPDQSGSAGPTRLRRGCSRPPRRPPDQAAASFTGPLRRPGDEGLTPPFGQQRLVAHHSPRDTPPNPAAHAARPGPGPMPLS